MRSTTPNAFVLSLTVHGGVAALFFLIAWFAAHQAANTPKIFELVAGPGNDIMATEAAKGAEDGTATAVKLPDIVPAVIPQSTPAEPIAAPPQAEPPVVQPPAPVVKTPPVAVAKVPEVAPQPKTIPNLTRTIARAEKKVEVAAANKAAKEKAAADRLAKEAALKEKTVSYQEFMKEQGKGAKPAQPGKKVPRIDSDGIMKGLTNGSGVGAGGKALTTEQHNEFDAYFSSLIQALRDAHQKPPGLSDLLQCRVEFYISSTGSISAVHVVRSSGNAEFDQSVLAAFAAVGTVGRPPDGKGDTFTVNFRMRDE